MYRQIREQIQEALNSSWKPIILILGLRQTGKTTLAEGLVDKDLLIRFNFDLLSDVQKFEKMDRSGLDFFAKINQNKYILIDEIQKYPPATGIIKHLYDNYNSANLKFILTGSSEVKIRRGIGDSLTGRMIEYKLYPLSLAEINIQSNLKFDPLSEWNNFQENQNQLQKYLVYGSLPAIQNIPPSEYQNFLQTYVNNILSRDLLELGSIRKPTQAYHLAKLLALQIGQLVNFSELALNTELNRNTVTNLINLFEQMGLIILTTPISTNERESISKATKIYFTDLGIRNTLINNFDDYQSRNDKGQLLENAVFVGIKRKLDYSHESYKLGFFRSFNKAEIDIVKKLGVTEELYEIKVSAKKSRLSKNITYITLDTAQKYLY